eukprot:CAMPEP_0206272260 /NCGR_PEP_ID=MMETSP0047_2-20121206/33909_1 /ASSEMBLY_ACC=CAM_ASM_000192 /TAXON_ID=195065 /ORGANISM="Chroomonas mesostigmatica_cf, Strain CCMP1168" /LENGTH=87 /DNA_ID=CAMNT_0053701161 /DNA_START=1685 /DNA_END=1948 /DNA_ORIENTATION=-
MVPSSSVYCARRANQMVLQPRPSAHQEKRTRAHAEEHKNLCTPARETWYVAEPETAVSDALSQLTHANPNGKRLPSKYPAPGKVPLT